MTCDTRATIQLYRVVAKSDGAPALFPVGVFCPEHWSEERSRRRSLGQLTGMSVFQDDRGPCQWGLLLRTPGATPVNGTAKA